ncbi:Protein of unknown function DUF2227, metal-binding protein [Stanieria cyanosphaera PCC 7437]|uniref:Metal-binding protein n=1 Tax=Stanieria cyanosphaera (strain ATCC 29371 / PCC 7437) TaxID=111780 RepID=K9XZT4_STAC7|nr:metal-binding protein [Stanieria cyanosphaera]AFZ37187.1 Protein of unknown function DUF2227, metal-binding protein [Stanieria cyanosphaera PCC 7437]
MPSGQTHDRITLWSLPWLAGISFCLTRNGELTLILAGSFLFSGLMFGPDLDIYSIQFKRWGLFRSLWLPYRYLFRHRSFFSHGFIIGTVVRLIYLLIFCLLLAIFVVAILQLIWGFEWNWQQVARQAIQLSLHKYLAEIIAGVIGLELGAMSHSLSDWCHSHWKNRQKNQLKIKSVPPGLKKPQRKEKARSRRQKVKDRN